MRDAGSGRKPLASGGKRYGSDRGEKEIRRVVKSRSDEEWNVVGERAGLAEKVPDFDVVRVDLRTDIFVLDDKRCPTCTWIGWVDSDVTSMIETSGDLGAFDLSNFA